jgi:hypothetical protein
MKWRPAVLFFGALVCAQLANSQILGRFSNPKIHVPIKHLPGLGLNVKRIAFGGTIGDCSDQLVDSITEQLVQGGLDVLDRAHLKTLLAEQNLSLSDRVDSASAIQFGKVLGSAAMIFVKVQRCTTQRDALHEDVKRNGMPVRIFISRTRAFFRGSIQAVDLTTGRVFAAQTLDYSPQRENRSDQGTPEFPSDIDMKDGAIRSAAVQSARLFVPWTETKDLVFFDDKDCGLKRAADLLKAGAVEPAVKQAEDNLAGCKSGEAKESTVAHAYYDLGLLQMISGKFDDAMANLTESARLHGGSIVNETIAECQRHKAVAEQERRLEKSVELAPPAVAAPPPSVQIAKPSPNGSLEDRLRQVDDLYKKGLITKAEYDAKKGQILKDL